MLLLLLAAQLSSTNCIPMANGGASCTTMTTPDMSQAPTTSDANHCALCNLVSILGQSANQRHAKAVGQMLANGDCSGAEKYALQKGDLDLADKVNAYCTHHHFETLDPNKEVRVPNTQNTDAIWGLTPNPHQ